MNMIETPLVQCPVEPQYCECVLCPVCGAPVRYYRPGCPECDMCDFEALNGSWSEKLSIAERGERDA